MSLKVVFLLCFSVEVIYGLRFFMQQKESPTLDIAIANTGQLRTMLNPVVHTSYKQHMPKGDLFVVIGQNFKNMDAIKEGIMQKYQPIGLKFFQDKQSIK